MKHRSTASSGAGSHPKGTGRLFNITHNKLYHKQPLDPLSDLKGSQRDLQNWLGSIFGFVAGAIGAIICPACGLVTMAVSAVATVAGDLIGGDSLGQVRSRAGEVWIQVWVQFPYLPAVMI